MSRSYRHFPCVSYINRGFKKIANHRVRHTLDLGNYSYYRKVFQSWDICDHKFLYFLSDYINDYICKLRIWRCHEYNCRISIRAYYQIYKWK